jgi:hypothetical protein
MAVCQGRFNKRLDSYSELRDRDSARVGKPARSGAKEGGEI